MEHHGTSRERFDPLSDPPGAPSPSGSEPLSCVACRSRKTRCDRARPACARCVRTGCGCVYPESRRKPNLRRRCVKNLEARLAQVEERLTQGVQRVAVDNNGLVAGFAALPGQDSSEALPGTTASHSHESFDMPDFAGQSSHFIGDGQLMSLGYSETLPPLRVQEELNNNFFLVQYHYLPVVHSGRYYQAFYGGPLRKPPMSLQYAVWATAAHGHSKYDEYHQVFYQRARQYAEADEMKGNGEHFIVLAHAQAWELIAAYEAKCMMFTRASVSGAKCVRLAQMMGLDRLDGPPGELPSTLGPATTWAELEERRRVFWGAFAIDSHTSISTGWSCLIDSDDITTRLPASEEAFVSGREETAAFMDDVFRGAAYSGFAGPVVICQVFKDMLQHVHRVKPKDRAEDVLQGPFWTRHRDLDNKLLSVFMFLPERFRLPQSLRSPSAIYTNLNLHAAVIILHHAAIEKQELHSLPESVKQTSLCRLRTSAEEIVKIVRMASYSTAIFRSPLCALCLYCATTVYVYLAKNDAKSGLTTTDMSNLELIMQAMEATAQHHVITYAFLQQVCLDIEGNGLYSYIRLPTLNKYRDMFGGVKSHVPVLVRSSVSKHTSMSPILLGKLPVDNSRRRPSPGNSTRGHGPPSNPVDRLVQEGLVNIDCFQSVLGAVTRNVAPRSTDNLDQRRKRMTRSIGPEAARDMPAFSALVEQPRTMRSGPWQPDVVSQTKTGSLVLPDRTSSSASSPGNRDLGGTDALSGKSSNTSLATGLGNTPEENRFDLRPLQGRISAPMWHSAEESFLVPPSALTLASGDDDANAAWALLNETMGWPSHNDMTGI